LKGNKHVGIHLSAQKQTIHQSTGSWRETTQSQ